MSDEIKAGSIVAIKSGGPDMTVSTVEDNYGTMTAWCVWFDGKKQCNGTFPVSSLRIWG